MEKKRPYAIDLSVLLIFFARPDTFEKVFESVRNARPSRLFLACDGPREGNKTDVINIAKCKEIASNIDWECDVYTNYSETNMGCGRRPSSAIKWAFSITDSLVVLEDDSVPYPSFYPYMKEMLEKYKDDTRIGYIAGFNHFPDWDCSPYSYFFAKNGPAAGAWGSWSRVWKDYDFYMYHLDNPRVKQLILKEKNKNVQNRRINSWQKSAQKVRSGEKVSFWDAQFGFLKYLYSYLVVVPKNSLVSNIGLGPGSSHAQNIVNENPIPSIFYAPDKPLDFPLNHPPFILRDYDYDELVDKYYLFPTRIRHTYRHILRMFKKIIKQS